MKKKSQIISVALTVCMFTACSSNNLVNNNSTKSNNDPGSNSYITSENTDRTSYKIEEFFESSDYDTYGYEWINSIKCINDELFISGGKTIESENRCIIVSDNSDEYQILNPELKYETVLGACIVDNTLYVLGAGSVNGVDLTTGKVTVSTNISGDVTEIQSDGSRFFFKDFAGDTIYIYDSDFVFTESKKIPEFLKTPAEMKNFRLLVTKDRIYIAGDVNGIISLYVLDNNFRLLFTKDYPDLPGMAYEIYDDGTNIILVSNESYTDPDTYEYSISSFVDVLNRNDGTVEKRYESPGTQFVFWNYSDRQMIINYLDDISVLNPESNIKRKVDLPENYNLGRIVQSSDKIIIFEDSEGEIVNSMTHISASGETCEYIFDSEIFNSGITTEGDVYYSMTDSNGNAKIIFKNNKFETYKEITLNNLSHYGYYGSNRIKYCKNKIYLFWNDYDNNNIVSVYDAEGNIVSEYMLDYPVIYNYISDGDSLYVIYDKQYDGCGISEIKEKESVPVTELAGYTVSKYYEGDDEFAFYYTAGSVVYGYDAESKSSTRIFNYIDSGISNIESLFTKISDGTYVCDVLKDNCVNYSKLIKADEETVNRMNNRKMIIAAGDTSYWSDAVYDAIIEFNKNSKDYLIVSKDYSETAESGIDKFRADIINGDIPDLFISGGSLDTKILENFDSLEKLDEYIEKSDISFEKFYPDITERSPVYYISPVIGFGMIKDTDGKSGLKGKVSTDEFIETAVKNNLKFSDCSRYEVFDYLVIDNLDDYVDYRNGTCSFESETFINLMNYIRDSENSKGTLNLDIYTNTVELFKYSGNESVFDVSLNADYSAHINENIKMCIFSGSAHKDAVWSFIKSLFENRKVFNEAGIPVVSDYTDSKELSVSDMFNIRKDDLTDLLSDGRILSTPDTNIISILYKEIDSFFDNRLTAEEYVHNIQNQVKLYLSEN